MHLGDICQVLESDGSPRLSTNETPLEVEVIRILSGEEVQVDPVNEGLPFLSLVSNLRVILSDPIFLDLQKLRTSEDLKQILSGAENRFHEKAKLESSKKGRKKSAQVMIEF